MYTRILILCLLALCGRVSTLAGDYVSDINSAAGHIAGHRVIYEMNVGSFTPSGTFAAAREQLGELKALGVDIVWLMPVYPRGTSGSPYAPTSLTQTNPRYGSVADHPDANHHSHQRCRSPARRPLSPTTSLHPQRATGRARTGRHRHLQRTEILPKITAQRNSPHQMNSHNLASSSTTHQAWYCRNLMKLVATTSASS